MLELVLTLLSIKTLLAPKRKVDTVIAIILKVLCHVADDVCLTFI